MRSEFMIDSLYSKYSAGLAAKKVGPRFLLGFPQQHSRNLRLNF